MTGVTEARSWGRDGPTIRPWLVSRVRPEAHPADDGLRPGSRAGAWVSAGGRGPGPSSSGSPGTRATPPDGRVEIVAEGPDAVLRPPRGPARGGPLTTRPARPGRVGVDAEVGRAPRWAALRLSRPERALAGPDGGVRDGMGREGEASAYRGVDGGRAGLSPPSYDGGVSDLPPTSRGCGRASTTSTPRSSTCSPSGSRRPRRVGELKAAAGLPPADPEREERQVARLRGLADEAGPRPPVRREVHHLRHRRGDPPPRGHRLARRPVRAPDATPDGRRLCVTSVPSAPTGHRHLRTPATSRPGPGPRVESGRIRPGAGPGRPTRAAKTPCTSRR